MASPSPPTILYLHGLASSPKGRKRDLLENRFGKTGFTLFAPDLNAPSFRRLDFFEMVGVARAACDRVEPRVIVGSSLGALVALSLSEALASSSSSSPFNPPLVLVAPALGFGRRWKERSPEAGEELDVFHHGEGKTMPIHRRFFEEMADVRVEGGDHGLVEFGDEIESAVRERMAR